MPSERAVLHIVPAEPWGGIQALVPMLAREQVRQGRSVRLLCLGPGPRIRELATAYGLADAAQGFAGLFAPWRLFLAMRGARGAIVHSHCEPVWASVMIALAAHGRWIEHAHVYPDGPMDWKAKIARSLQRRFAMRHIAISHSIGQALIAQQVAAPATLDVVHNGVAIEPAPPARDRATARFTLGFVGRVVEEKGIFDFIELAALLAPDPAIAFAIYGDGADLAAARALAATQGLAERIVFHGYVADIAAAWAAIDMAAIFSHREPFGLVFLEAAQQGVPTISYANDSGGSEVAATLEGAHRVAPGDLAAAAAIVRSHAADRQPAHATIARDRHVVAERFGIATMERGIAASYRKLDRNGPTEAAVTP